MLHTVVCGIRRIIGKEDDKIDLVDSVFPLAGDLENYGGHALDSVINLIDPEANDGKNGLDVILKGGFHNLEDGLKRNQQVAIRFLCDENLEGTEGEYEAEDKYEHSDEPLKKRTLAARDGEGENEGEGGDGEQDGDKPPFQLGDLEKAALIYESYGPAEDDASVDVLKLTWKTKYSCPKRAEEGNGDNNGDNNEGDNNGDDNGGNEGEGGDGDSSSASWGFFTWLVLM